MEKTKSQELPLDTANVTQEKVNRQKTWFSNYSFMFSPKMSLLQSENIP